MASLTSVLLGLLVLATAGKDKKELKLSQKEMDNMLEKAKQQQAAQQAAEEMRERDKSPLAPPDMTVESPGTKVRALQYSADWQDQVWSLAADMARELSQGRELLADEMDTYMVDTHGRQVASTDNPGPSRFPILVKFVPWSDNRFLQVKKFELAFDDWEQSLGQSAEEFARQNGVTRDNFFISVFDNRGVKLQRNEKPVESRFPVKVKFVPTGPSRKKTVEIEYVPAGGWKEEVVKAISNFAEEMGVRSEDIGSAVYDNEGKVVGSSDFPIKSQFPIKLHLIYKGIALASGKKRFEMEYVTDWRDRLTKRIGEFTALHGLRPGKFKIDVLTRTGSQLPDDVDAELFPVAVEFTPMSAQGGRKRKRKGKSSQEEL